MFETMLIVDDLYLERQMLKKILQDTYTILEASDGEECMRILEQCKGKIDVIILDLIMPNMDGFEVLEKKKNIDYLKDIPVVVMTASGAVDDQVRAFECGANDFITKPIMTDIAKFRINNVIAAQKRFDMLIKDKQMYKMQSEIDLMTGLFNKITMETIVDKILTQNKKSRNAMLLIDIDNFKAVNDIEGHQVGDHTIRIIADLISGLFGENDIVGRIGGDEFLVFMEDLQTEMIARKKGQDIVRLMKYKPNLTIPANVTLSIGLAFSDNKDESFEHLFKKADEALYLSKKYGKARMTEFGVDVITTDEKDDYVVLCSRNRNVCSVIESVFDKGYHFIGIVNVNEINNIYNEIGKNMKLALVDISDLNEYEDTLGVVAEFNPNIPVMMLCKEGNMNQYREVLKCENVADILSVPIEVQQFKRRAEKILDNMEKEKS